MSTAGDADEEPLPTLVLVHGECQGSKMWRRQAALSRKFHVVTPDLPGYGADPGRFTMVGAVAMIRRVLDQTGPAHLCGISLGAMVAAETTARHPALIRRLVLSAPVIAPAQTQRRLLRRRRRMPGWLVRRLTDLPDQRTWLAVLDEYAAVDLASSMRLITAPTLVLCGRRDLASLPDAYQAAAIIPNARLVIVPRVGRAVPASATLFNTLVTGFLAP